MPRGIAEAFREQAMGVPDGETTHATLAVLPATHAQFSVPILDLMGFQFLQLDLAEDRIDLVARQLEMRSGAFGEIVFAVDHTSMRSAICWAIVILDLSTKSPLSMLARRATSFFSAFLRGPLQP
jgi:hypothetical protein